VSRAGSLADTECRDYPGLYKAIHVRLGHRAALRRFGDREQPGRFSGLSRRRHRPAYRLGENGEFSRPSYTARLEGDSVMTFSRREWYVSPNTKGK
jgi:hypothetical protein